MEALRRREIAQLVAFVHDATELESPLPFPPELLDRLGELVPTAEIVTYCELDWKRRRVPFIADQLEWTRDPYVAAAYWELHDQHAVCEYVARTGDFRPRRMTDLLTHREWRSREFYNLFNRPLPVRARRADPVLAPDPQPDLPLPRAEARLRRARPARAGAPPAPTSSGSSTGSSGASCR